MAASSLGVQYHVNKRRESAFDIVACLRRSEHRGCPLLHGEDLEVLHGHAHVVLQITLVAQEHYRYFACGRCHRLDPVSQLAQALLTGDVTHGQRALGPIEVRLAKNLSETRLPHDIPDQEHDPQLLACARILEIHLLLRHLRADCRDVLVIENIHHESPDETRLADANIADETHLKFLDLTTFDQWLNNSLGL